jgi:hypothetical protein
MQVAVALFDGFRGRSLTLRAWNGKTTDVRALSKVVRLLRSLRSWFNALRSSRVVTVTASQLSAAWGAGAAFSVGPGDTARPGRSLRCGGYGSDAFTAATGASTGVGVTVVRRGNRRILRRAMYGVGRKKRSESRHAQVILTPRRDIWGPTSRGCVCSARSVKRQPTPPLLGDADPHCQFDLVKSVPPSQASGELGCNEVGEAAYVEGHLAEMLSYSREYSVDEGLKEQCVEVTLARNVVPAIKAELAARRSVGGRTNELNGGTEAKESGDGGKSCELR